MQSRNTAYGWGLPALAAVLLSAALAFSPAPALAQAKKVDLNTADLKTLETLPGIGATLAQRIIDGRPYKKMSDLSNVDGMTKAKLDGLKSHVTFSKVSSTKTAKTSKSKSTTTQPSAQEETSTTATKPSGTKKSPPAATSPTGSATGKLAPGQKVNINTASAEELDALPGIGPTKAQAIVDYRNANGPFKSIEDIQKVSGIKSGEFSKIQDYIKLSR
jgi:competence protein ComEA